MSAKLVIAYRQQLPALQQTLNLIAVMFEIKIILKLVKFCKKN